MRASTGIRAGNAGKKGRGVFAVDHFHADDLIERAPLIVIKASDVEEIEETDVSSYWYDFDGGRRALGLGFTSLYNHSSRPNAEYAIREDPDLIEIVALREIKPGAEIKVNYNGDSRIKTKLYFEKDSEEPEDSEEFEDEFTHFNDYGGWHIEGWVWCGKQTSLRTTIPSLVTCKDCIDAMVEAKAKLAGWSPSLRPRRITKHGVLVTFDWLVKKLDDYDLADGVIVAEDLRKALRRIPAKQFPGFKNGKAK